jgi:hypothetical protein
MFHKHLPNNTQKNNFLLISLHDTYHLSREENVLGFFFSAILFG